MSEAQLNSYAETLPSFITTPREEFEPYAGTLTIPASFEDEAPAEARHAADRLEDLPENTIVFANIERTAIGDFNGAFKDVKATELGGQLVRSVLEGTGIDDISEQVDAIFVGQIFQTEDGMAPANQIKYFLGSDGESIISPRAIYHSINGACGSPLHAILTAVSKVKDEGNGVELAIAAGIESMTRSPHYMEGSRNKRGLGDIPFIDSVLRGLTDAIKNKDGKNVHMGKTVDDIASIFGITRENADAYALRDHLRAALAIKEGVSGDNTPVEIQLGRGRGTRLVTVDEHVNGETTLESLARLRTVFDPNGILTAGNSSSINDGAAATIVTTAGKARRIGLVPTLSLRSSGEIGLPHEQMSLGPILAARIALKEAGLTIEDMDTVEVNAAFAPVPLIFGQEMGVPDHKLNPFGSAVAYGHPVGMSFLAQLKRIENHQRRYPNSIFGLGAICIGGGQGGALVVKRVAA